MAFVPCKPDYNLGIGLLLLILCSERVTFGSVVDAAVGRTVGQARSALCLTTEKHPLLESVTGLTALTALCWFAPAGEVQLRDVFAAFAGFGIRSPGGWSAKTSSSGAMPSSGDSRHLQQPEAIPSVFKPLVLEMDGFR